MDNGKDQENGNVYDKKLFQNMTKHDIELAKNVCNVPDGRTLTSVRAMCINRLI